MRYLRNLFLALFVLVLSPAAHAHVGSKDVFETVSSGPYKLFVTIRTPTVIPGVAVIEVRSTGAPVTGIHITPMPITGEAAKHPPTPDAMQRSSTDPAFYTGNLWMMATGSWQVRFDISGAAGEHTASVPVPAVAVTTLKMQRSLGIVLALLGIFLVFSMAGIVAAAVREARLQSGQTPDPNRRKRALAAMAASLAIMALMVYGGAKWWNVEAAGYADGVYRPLEARATLVGDVLNLHLSSFHSEERSSLNRSNNDFLPDHGHLIHLYAIRQPEMDAVFHLHPEFTGKGTFTLSLPPMPPGRYTLYGDIVHANGFPETIVTTLDVPAGMIGTTPGPDDATAQIAPLSQGTLGTTYKLPDGYTMVWDRPAALTASTAYQFHYTLLTPDGRPANDVQPYMGMAGHAAFVKTDGTVFAHTHPEGSAAMAAMMLANGDSGNMGGPSDSSSSASMDSMPGMDMSSAQPLPNSVDFPYGFPTSGRYRIFIQMKHGATIETGAFDATVQ